MKKQILLTVILVIATVAITILYFRNLNLTGHSTANIMQDIPADASMVFEFSNDEGFYDVYNSSPLFNTLVDTAQLHQLSVLRHQVLQNASLQPYFNNQDIYISIHPQGDLLLTIQTTANVSTETLIKSFNQSNSHIQVAPLEINKVKGFTITLPQLNQKFKVINRGDHIYSGSFSASLITEVANHKQNTSPETFTPLPPSEQTNALANLYINYTVLSPLLDHWFKLKNADYLKPLRLLPGIAALTLNYKSDGLMFSGYTTLDTKLPASYLTLFKNQRPFVSQLKDIFPGITAYSSCFSVSDPSKFQKDLTAWQDKAGLSRERRALMLRVKAETGVNVDKEFKSVLGNEFALLTTRFDDKLAIIQLTDGSKLLPVFMNISTMNANNTGRLNYQKLPFFLLGDAFTLFKQPYFAIVDNYLILTNTQSALNNYIQIYNNRQFLSKQERYNEFDDLLAEKSNAAFFVHFKNAAYLLKRDLKSPAYQTIGAGKTDTATYYAGAWQLSSADKQFYTNVCLQLNHPDTTKSR